ncbi:hypothetical protein MMC28_007097 [Mycoblastus sanguinarius]|nr:hypothetical protein [Mycoblastus sanguinarius]
MDFSSFSNIVDGKERSSKTTYHENDLNDAVHAARNAFSSWSQTSFEKRCELVKRYAEAFVVQENGFPELLMKETGKPRELANREIHSSYEGMIEATRWTLPEERLEDDKKTATVRYVPLVPLVLSFAKIAPALVAGNCIIVKPSPYTPYTTLKAVEVGNTILPPGVLQALGGCEKLGPWIVSHPGIQKISFTGSIPTGKKIMEVCAKTMKRVTLELGGNDAAIVCPDVDIQTTAPAVVMAAFKNPGQICVASKRIYVHQSIYQPFLAAMVSHTASLNVGDPFADNIDLGPIQNAMQYSKVQTLLTDCKTRGYNIATTTSQAPNPSKGYDHPTHHHRQPAQQLPHRGRRTIRPHHPRAAVDHGGRRRPAHQ